MHHPSEPVARVVKLSPSFSADIVEIFQRRGCSIEGCHGTGAGTLFLTDTATSYTSLIDIPSGCPGLIRVVPGDADNSFLVMKVEGTHPRSCGRRMPLNDEPLDSIDQANIRNWVTQDAFNN